MLNNINISSKQQQLIVYALLTIVTLAIFWQVNQFGFVNFDDNSYVTENSIVQSGITLDGVSWAFSTKFTGLWNPLIWLSFMFDYQLYGLNAGGYHLTNLILHVMSALLLFWLFNRMTGTIWRSAFVAALFALHPLHVESVAWVAERKDVLSTFFWMLTLCLYVYYTENPIMRRYLTVLLCFICALMSKPMVITLPVVMILLDYWPLSRLQSRKIVTKEPEVMPVSTKQGKKKNKSKKEALKENIYPPQAKKLLEPKIAGIIPLWQIREKLPFFILSAVIAIISLYNPDNPSDKLIPFGDRIANALVTFVTYLGKTFWPHDMAVFYPFPTQIPAWQVIGAFLLIVVITTVVSVMVRRLPYLFVGWMWYAITVAPVIGIIQISAAAPYAMADRYHYLPSVGIAAILAWGIPLLFPHENISKKILFSAGTVSLAIMSVFTWQQCGYWKNSIDLWSHALQVTKDNYLAHNNRGIFYNSLGQYQLALEDYNQAIRQKPDYAEAYNNRGIVFKKIGQYQRAIEDNNKAISLNPCFAGFYNNRGNTYNYLGQHQLAIEDYNQAIRLKPDYAESYNNRGNTYNSLGQYQLAVEDYNQAIHLKPDYADAFNNRAYVYLNLRNIKACCDDAQKACELGNCKMLEIAKGKGACR